MTDDVNQPEHYKGKSLECIQVIEAFNLGFNLGNDLQKAAWYLQREIGRLAKEW